jgi:quinol monooxygenase YgiN
MGEEVANMPSKSVTKTVTFIVRLDFAPEDREEIKSALTAVAAAAREEPGCLDYVPCTVDGDPDHVMIWEQYADQAAAEAHRATPHFKKYVVGVLYQKMRQRSVENLNAVA